MREERMYGLILLLLPLLFVAGAYSLLNFNGLYGQDAHRYFQFLGELDWFFNEGIPLGEFHWPVLYPLTGLMFKTIFGIDGALALQLVSAISLGLSGFLVFRILKSSRSVDAFVFVLLFLVLCPQLLVAGVLCMSDLFSMMWVVLVWYFYFKWKREGNSILVFNLVAVAALATISRYPAFLLVVVPLAVVFFNLLAKKWWMAVLMPVVFLLFCLPEFALHQAPEYVSENYLLKHWSPVNLFQSTFQTNDGGQVHRFINLVYITYPFWHPAFFLVGFVFAVFAVFKFSRKKVPWVIPVSILLYLLFLGGLEIQSRRFLVLVFPLILICIYQMGFGEMLKATSKKLIVVGVLVLGAAQFSIAAYYVKPYVELNHFERQLAEDLQAYEGAKLYTFYWDVALLTYDSGFDFHNLWEEEVKGLEEHDLVLFNPIQLAAQWQETRVMENWNFIHANYQLTVLKTWSNGWKLYEVQGAI